MTLPPARQPAAGAISASRLERLVLQQQDHSPQDLPQRDPRRLPLARRRLTAEQAAAQNLLCMRRGPINLRAGGTMVSVALTGARQLPVGAAWLELEIEGHPARIGLSWGAARRQAGLPLENTDPADAALLIEDSLAAWLDDVEAQAGLSIRFRSLVTEPEETASAVHLGLRLEVMQKPPAQPYRQQMPLELSPAAARALGPVLSRWTAPIAEDLPLKLRTAVEIDNMRLSVAELASLGPGDALVLTEVPDSARIVIESQFTALARPAGEGPLPAAWSLAGPFTLRSPRDRTVPTASRSEVLMSDTDTPSPEPAGQTPPPAEPAPRGPRPPQAGAAPSTESLDALELRLSFRLGETLMSLAELRRAGPGTIITLDRPDGALVDILANGQLIGTGEVISVAGQRAIEIRSLFGDG
ncbi:FliM/FliN family flagellar motor switch protein [Paracoccus sulfuroxidans]|uniref:Type III secretion protein Q n=1 Tax=Paracoccus sulfuroxidans TaxID=384678 RepID=A0A562NSE7_9RHOB|nr:FliM/FliN family flagellar motor switch protein [Paracoccus sulfuroxidans]TWI35137.1 type III secretion protein Q [Paracoccus sulfuroxidans]